jgi:mannan endo-1,4-beta-mannosidase
MIDPDLKNSTLAQNVPPSNPAANGRSCATGPFGYDPRLMWRTLVMILLATALTAPMAGRGPIFLYAGNARRTDVARCTTQPAVGDYLTGFEKPTSRVAWTIAVTDAGAYDVRMKYRSLSGKKRTVVRIGTNSFEADLPPADRFQSLVVGRADLAAGPVELAVEKGDGYYDLAQVELAPVHLVPPVKPPGVPCDPAATPEAGTLLKKLCGSFGDVTLTGQYGDADEQLIIGLTGKRPAIFGADLMDFSPSRVEHGARPGPIAEDLIRRSRQGQTVTLCWHWNAPAGLIDNVVTGRDGKTKDLRWYKGFYTDATTFDVEAALADPSSESYQLLLRDIDAIAVPLKQLSDAGVPVLWRPLHEAQGKWFWWGARGSGPFKKLWRMTFDRLVRVHGLHNLLWVYTSDTDPAWYPGDDVVDVVGIDAYPKNPHDVMAGHWVVLSDAFGGKKPLAMSECGGMPDVRLMYRLGCPWSGQKPPAGRPGHLRRPPREIARRHPPKPQLTPAAKLPAT